MSFISLQDHSGEIGLVLKGPSPDEVYIIVYANGDEFTAQQLLEGKDSATLGHTEPSRYSGDSFYGIVSFGEFKTHYPNSWKAFCESRIYKKLAKKMEECGGAFKSQ